MRNHAGLKCLHQPHCSRKRGRIIIKYASDKRFGAVGCAATGVMFDVRKIFTSR